MRASVGALGTEGTGKQDALKGIFRVNREIGRLSMEFGRMRPVLRELQLEVNLVTIDIKRGRTEAAKERATKVSTALERVRRAALASDGSRPSQGI
jgi:hypothetical protein